MFRAEQKKATLNPERAITTAGTNGLNIFVEASDASARDAAHALITGAGFPTLALSIKMAGFRIIPLQTLIVIKPNALRLIDRVHVLGMISASTVNQS